MCFCWFVGLMLQGKFGMGVHCIGGLLAIHLEGYFKGSIWGPIARSEVLSEFLRFSAKFHINLQTLAIRKTRENAISWSERKEHRNYSWIQFARTIFLFCHFLSRSFNKYKVLLFLGDQRIPMNEKILVSEF